MSKNIDGHCPYCGSEHFTSDVRELGENVWANLCTECGKWSHHLGADGCQYELINPQVFSSNRIDD